MQTTSSYSGAILLLLIATLSFLPRSATAQSNPVDIIVNTTSDVADFGGAQQVSDLPGPDGLISLREAILAANNTPGPQVIGFNIPTSDPGFDGAVFTIEPLSPYFTLADGGTMIDGTTQAAFMGQANAAAPTIVLKGSSAGDASGLFLSSSGNVVRRLVINRFRFAGVTIHGSSAVANVVEGNFIGTDATGTAPEGNIQFGMFVAGEASNNVITGNLISGNQNIPFGAGVYIHGEGTLGNQVLGNLIGTDITGTLPIPNGEEGVEVATAQSSAVIAGNIIAFNLQQGIVVFGNATISRNSIFSNGGLGIDLGAPQGVNTNDPGDADAGPNALMNFPVLSSAHAAPGRLVVKGTIDTPNPGTVTIEFFANPVPTPGSDPSGHGEGAVFLGTVRPNPQGTFTVALPPVAAGTFITATATDANGNTSEFAENIAATFE